MELEDIYRRDLNLLIALRVLIEEGSVSKAAQRLNLSQSAMSRVLGRLRVLLDDPLFTRQGQHLIPTQKALDFNQSLTQPLENIRDILSPQEFEPQECRQKFTIATTDYAMQTILPFALPRIYQEAPNLQLKLVPLQHNNLVHQLTTQGADIAICRPTYSVAPLHSDILGKVSVFCLLSSHHPLANVELTLDDYLNSRHAMIAISDGVKALIDEALSDYPSPNLVLRSYHLEAALAVMDTLPLIVTVPADLAYLVAKRYNLVIKQLPFNLTPFDYSLIWHSRCDHAASQQWLRGVLKQECGKLIAERIKVMGIE
ncbi:LysR family transcriptional regulator [Vibrio sp. CK2-1]|uniref:LysR family transcriptional regulator n=1 Tax=Vibrio sp. CK2-1 TaxID=2912249 RepID=UPI001F24FA64|nr:LysR family transcriptional regulator [Vibrio sp. CK2-1]MCF7355657.1 LysR family transcriptional regulator [Vibrio sp. CK2-1]